MNRRFYGGLISGVTTNKTDNITMKQVQNGEEERVVLRRYPFHEAPTQRKVLEQYMLAVEYMFRIVPEDQQAAVLGRFSRKLMKAMRNFK